MKTKFFFLLTFLAFSASWGQINIVAGGTATENFNSLGASSSASLPTGWKAQKTTNVRDLTLTYSTAVTAVELAGGNNILGTAGNGIYRFNANNVTTESALGGLSSGSASKTVAFMSYFNNNAATTISSFTISYNVEKFRGGSNAAGFTIDLLYSTNGTTWTSCGAPFITSFTADASNAGYTPAPTTSTAVSGTYTPSGSIPQNSKFYFAWRYSVTSSTTSSNAQALGFDDISITAVGGGASPAEINLKGNAVSIVDGDTTPVTTDHTDFGTVATSTNMARTYTIENLGGTVLNISSIAMASGTDFVVSGIPSSVAAGSSATFTVTFNSAVGGPFTNTVNVISDDTDEATYTFDVKAIAQAPTPNIQVKGNSNVIPVADTTPSTTDHTDFGSNGTSTNVVKTYTIENTGTGNLTVNNILMLNAPTSKYTIGGISFPATVTPSSSTTFTVTFNSAVAGTFSDNVLIDNNDPTDSTYDFAVTATSVALNFVAGDISITGMTTTTDSFSFVNWVAIPIDAELYFTDNAYDGAVLATNENTLRWKNNTGSIIPVGTVVKIEATPATDLGTIISGNLNGLAQSNETILIYEGSAASPNFIYGISNAAWITTGVPTNSNSYLPASLNITNGNIVIGSLDNYEYNASRNNQETFADYKTMVSNPANWLGNNTFFALSSADFKLAVVWQSAAWSNTTGPTSSLSAVIKDVYNTNSNGALTAIDLIIKTGGQLTVEQSNPVTVSGNLINNLTETAIVVNNGGTILQATNTATNNNTGNITYKRTTSTLPNNHDFVYWGSPVQGQTLSGMWMTTANDTFYSFDTAKSGGQDWAYAAPSTTMDAGKGYISRALTGSGSPTWNPGASWTANFVGKPNNGNVPFTMVNAGGANIDNLMSNPYPSALDLVAFRTDIDNSAKLTGNFYFWTHNTPLSGSNTYSGSDYAIFNVAIGGGTSTSGATPAPDQFVDACQGFFVEAATAGTVTFKNSHRVVGNNNAFYRNATVGVTIDKLWLNLTNTSGVFKQQLLAYATGASNDFDPTFDAKSFDGNPAVDFYSVIPNNKLAIQSRALPFNNQDLVPLGYKSAIAGNFTISIDHLDGNLIGKTIYLQDNLLGIDHELTASDYSFNTATGTFDNRFVLKYSSALSTDTEDYLDNSIMVVKDKNVLKIKSSIKELKSVVVFDLLGRKVYSKDAINSLDFSDINIVNNNQTIIVKVTLANGVVITKKVFY